MTGRFVPQPFKTVWVKPGKPTKSELVEFLAEVAHRVPPGASGGLFDGG